ncbi:hypothetical protein [Croceicoccus sp. YJ47]|uniref:hypothetical protein n=1 Tax=Croceicoccus sp. YJ47 TaxID=2798724 RepID=UPI0019236775|nr:hypothetical protein [Croceicoccus sp. YJ47]QQN73930.1 hypothetical protein JD971_14465 [Croceicoccus sp. YJ47]
MRWAIAEALREIREEDDLTDADMGALLGKSADRVRAYRREEATMDAETFGRGKREFNGRFTGYFDRLCIDSRPGPLCDRHGQSSILAAALALSVALEDGEIDADEVRENRQTLENARDAIDAQLRKLRPAQAVGQ